MRCQFHVCLSRTPASILIRSLVGDEVQSAGGSLVAATKHGSHWFLHHITPINQIAAGHKGRGHRGRSGMSDWGDC